MKVCLVGPLPVVAGAPRGGVESAVSGLASALVDLGVELVVVDPFNGVEGSQGGFQAVGVEPLTTREVVSLRPPARVAEAISRTNADLVHLHLTPQWARHVRPSVVTVHGLAHVESRIRRPGPGGWFRSIVLRDRLMRGVRSADALIAISPEIQRMGVKARTPTVMIPNAVASSFFGVDSGRGQDWLCIGALTPLKNQTLALAAFARYRIMGGKGRLHVVGEAPEPSYEAECRAAAIPLGTEVEFTGPLSRAELMSCLEGARGTLSTSRRETSSMALVESLAAGVPVVSLDTGTARDQLAQARLGRVIPIDASIEVIARAMLSQELESWNVEELRASVRRQHPSEVARSTLAIYQAALDRGRETSEFGP